MTLMAASMNVCMFTNKTKFVFFVFVRVFLCTLCVFCCLAISSKKHLFYKKLSESARNQKNRNTKKITLTDNQNNCTHGNKPYYVPQTKKRQKKNKKEKEKKKKKMKNL